MKKASELIYNGGEIFRQSPIALRVLQANGGGGQKDVDVLFANFVGYAAANWTYETSSKSSTSEGILNDKEGAKAIVACATIGGAFKKLVEEYAPKYATSNESLNSSNGKARFLVKPGLKCFDQRVIGNVGNHGAKSPQQFGVATYFPEHYFVKVGSKYYDPCLMATYMTLDGPILQHTKNISLGPRNPPLMKVGSGRQLMFLQYQQTSPLPGFSGRYFLLTPKECKGLLDADGVAMLKKDQDVMAGRFFS